MEIKVKLNNEQYKYDVYQIINIFYSLSDIKFFDEDWDYCIEINEKSIIIIHNNVNKEIKLSYDIPYKDAVKKGIFEYFTYETGKEMPWGALIGVKPSKIALNLISSGKDIEYIINYFKNHYNTREDKAKLCINIAKVEEKFVNIEERNVSIYIGMPFCPTRCIYCSFTSNPIGVCKDMVEPYLHALNYEIQKTSEYVKNKNLNVECVYFGGGTPTAVNDEQFEKVMEHIYSGFIYKNNIKEFTVECGRPDSITLSKLKSMKKYDVHRISINPQTMNDETLKLIGRNHSVKDVIDTYKMARECGLQNINMDIIVGLPGEGLSHVEKTCGEILMLSPESITVHGMSVKRASRLHENIINKVQFNIPEQKELNKMYEKTVSLSKDLNMKPYYMYRQKNMVGNMENIGYTKEGKEAIYNIQMIEERQTIIACGAGSVTKVVFLDENRIERHFNVKDVREYISRIEEMVEKKLSLLDTLFNIVEN
jgi:oxygen-independent coproporphyrinogen-3 oxidase